MKRIALFLFAVVVIALGLVTARAETSTPTNEAPPKLIVDPPVPDLLAQGVVWITWQVENVNIGPMSGKEHLHASPRVGHLHIHVDDLPWLWAHMSMTPIDVALLPPGPHKIRIDLVNAIHQAVESKTVTFDIPKGASPH